MSRLRHPIRAIREPFGTAGLVVACIALIAALGGTAIAAGKLTSKQKKEVEKIAKKFAGKPGAPGAQGPAGPQGAAGANGKDGAAGQNGTNGTNGTNGASVSAQELGAGDPNCPAGGSEFKVGSGTPSYVCNGSPWPGGGLLPSGETETGTWAAAGENRLEYSENGSSELVKTEANSTVLAPISFALPVKPAPEVIYVEGASATDCPGIQEGLPTAEPGKLCVYLKKVTGSSSTPIFTPGSEFFLAVGADSMGTVAYLTCENSTCVWAGVWAVTAE
jgi:collagen triple helix repeat protein